MLTDFNPNDVTELDALITGKTVASVLSNRDGMNDRLVFVFTDGSTLELEYDYIYGYEIRPTADKDHDAPA